MGILNIPNYDGKNGYVAKTEQKSQKGVLKSLPVYDGKNGYKAEQEQKPKPISEAFQSKKLVPPPVASFSSNPLLMPTYKNDVEKIQGIMKEKTKAPSALSNAFLDSADALRIKNQDTKVPFGLGDSTIENVAKGATALGLSAAKSLTNVPFIGSLLELEQKKNMPQMYEKSETLQKQYPISSTIGNIIGYLPMGIGASKLAAPLVKSIVNPITRVATQEAIAGAGIGLVDSTTRGLKDNLSGSDLAKSIATNTLAGGALGGVLGGAGAKLGQVISKYKADKALKNIDTPPVESNSLNPIITPELNAPILNNPFKLAKAPQGTFKIKPKEITPMPTNMDNAISNEVVSPLNTPKTQSNMISPILENKPIKTNVATPQSNMDVNIKSKFDTIKTVDDLPDNVDELQAFVDDMAQKQKHMKIDLQLFSEAQKKLSKFRTNTIERSMDIPEDVKSKELQMNEFDYVPETSKEWQTTAEKNIAMNKEKVIKDIENSSAISGGVQAHEAAILTKDLLNEARTTGNYSKFKNFLKKVVEKTRETARALKGTDTAWDKRTAEGALNKAQRTIDNVEDSIRKQNPKVSNRIDDDIKQAKKEIDDVKKESEKIIDEEISKVIKTKSSKKSETNFPQILSNRILNALNPKMPEEKSFIKEMLNDLFGEAKEKIAMPTKISNNRSAIEKVRDTIKFADYTGEIRANAQKMLNEMFKDNPQILKIFDDYFNLGYKPTKTEQFQKQINEIINKKLGSNGINKWVKDWYATGREAKENFVDAIIRETGLDGQQAKQLKNILDTRFKNELKAKRESILERLMTPKEKKMAQKEKSIEKLNVLTNVGMFENQKFVGRISEKISTTIKQMLSENNLTLNDVVRMSLKDRNNAKAILLRDVFKNARVSDNDVIQLLDVINKEFNAMTKNKQSKILESMLKERTSNPKSGIEKLIEKINLGVYDDEIDSTIRDAIKQKYGLPILSDDDVKFIVETMDGIKDMAEGRQKDIALAKVQKLISDKVPPTFRDKIKSYQRTNLLLNPKTMIRNVSGNIIYSGALTNVKDVVRAGLDKVVSKTLKSNRTAFLPSFKTQAKGMVQGAKNTLEDYKLGIDTSNIPTQFELDTQRVTSPFKNKILKKADDLTRLGLKMGDTPFYKAAYDEALRQQMKANGVKTATEEMKAFAKNAAEERTFQDTNNYVKFFNGLRDTLNILGYKGFGLGDVILPFTKTPANILKAGVEYSPLNVVKVANNAYKLIKEGGAEAQYKFVDSLAKTLTGTGLLGAGMYLASSGIMTGDKPSNNDAATFKNEQGVLPYALKVGNDYISFDWAQPASIPLAMGADIYYNLKDAKTPTESIMKGLQGGTNTLFSQSMIQGMQRLFSTYENNQTGGLIKNLTNAGYSAILQMLPFNSLSRQTAELIDPNNRSTYDDTSIESQLTNKAISSIPYSRMALPPKIKTTGEVTNSRPWYNVLFNPANVGTTNITPVKSEILRLFDESGEDIQFPRIADKEISYKTKEGNQKKQLNGKERSRYQELLGTETMKNIETLVKTREYISKKDAEKANLIQNTITKTNNAVKKKLLKELGINAIN